MASKTPLNSYISTRIINGAPSEVLFNGAADAASIKFYQPNPTLLDAGDFVAFGVAVVPQLSAFKITTTPYSGADRITLRIQASIT